MGEHPKYSISQVVINSDGWTRTIFRVEENYLHRLGRYGYFYKDDFGGFGMCSQEHLSRWQSRTR